MKNRISKLNLGAGTQIRDGFINLDCTKLEGIDIVYDLNQYPWPFQDNEFDYLLAEDVIEHLENPLRAIEEIYRICSDDAVVNIQVPYWNSWSANTDLTHRHRFTENSFDYFDSKTLLGSIRHYYSHAKFDILEKNVVITPLLPMFPLPKISHITIKNKLLLKVLFIIAGFVNNIVQDLIIKMKVIK